jgi:hypothetical protein
MKLPVVGKYDVRVQWGWKPDSLVHIHQCGMGVETGFNCHDFSEESLRNNILFHIYTRFKGTVMAQDIDESTINILSIKKLEPPKMVEYPYT